MSALETRTLYCYQGCCALSFFLSFSFFLSSYFTFSLATHNSQPRRCSCPVSDAWFPERGNFLRPLRDDSRMEIFPAACYASSTQTDRVSFLLRLLVTLKHWQIQGPGDLPPKRPRKFFFCKNTFYNKLANSLGRANAKKAFS